MEIILPHVSCLGVRAHFFALSAHVALSLLLAASLHFSDLSDLSDAASLYLVVEFVLSSVPSLVY